MVNVNEIALSVSMCLSELSVYIFWYFNELRVYIFTIKMLAMISYGVNLGTIKRA